jgi:hypothetical protein
MSDDGHCLMCGMSQETCLCRSRKPHRNKSILQQSGEATVDVRRTPVDLEERDRLERLQYVEAWAAIARAGMWLQPCWACGSQIVTNQKIACCRVCWEQLPNRYPG